MRFASSSAGRSATWVHVALAAQVLAMAALELRGRSGRGDTCVGSYLSRRLSAEPADATRWAAALTSLKLEAEGAGRCSRADVDAAIRNRYQ